MRFVTLSLLAALVLIAAPGCALIPDVTHEPQFHNPFPQLYRVAILPFANQSKEPTVDGDAVALAYYNELQTVRGFEVMPIGVAKQLALASGIAPRSPADFQKLARFMGVDAVVIGSVTEYTPYYPPRMGLAVNWYAANPNFHPAPPGYGLPWGTPHEDEIPEELVFDAEFSLAREQLATQSPEFVPTAEADAMPAKHEAVRAQAVDRSDSADATPKNATKQDENATPPAPSVAPPAASADVTAQSSLPSKWPDPRGFIPPAPSLTRPQGVPQSEPVMTHTRMYHGNQADFTAKLERYYYFRDEARFGGWQSYLQRSEDFTRFCCHLHVTEMLAARGGVSKPRVVYRWPISRYER